MTSFSATARLLALALLSLNLYFRTLATGSNVSLSYMDFGKDSNFTSQLVLHGDAKVSNDSMSVQIGGSVSVSDAGSLVLKKPINLEQMLSFSMYLVFSMSRRSGNGLAFIMLPGASHLNAFSGGSDGMLAQRNASFVVVKFESIRDLSSNDVNANVFSVVVDTQISKATSHHLMRNTGQKLQAWIDYESSYKRIEVRLSQLNDNRPAEPLINSSIDWSKLLKARDATIGLASTSGTTSQRSNVYSIVFTARSVPDWLHSKPMDPNIAASKEGQAELMLPRKQDCADRILAALSFGIGCGALVALIVLFLRTIFVNMPTNPVISEDYTMNKDDFEYKKFSVALDKAIK